jgi:hypothetical protein
MSYHFEFVGDARVALYLADLHFVGFENALVPAFSAAVSAYTLFLDYGATYVTLAVTTNSPQTSVVVTLGDKLFPAAIAQGVFREFIIAVPTQRSTPAPFVLIQLTLPNTPSEYVLYSVQLHIPASGGAVGGGVSSSSSSTAGSAPFAADDGTVTSAAIVGLVIGGIISVFVLGGAYELYKRRQEMKYRKQRGEEAAARAAPASAPLQLPPQIPRAQRFQPEEQPPPYSEQPGAPVLGVTVHLPPDESDAAAPMPYDLRRQTSQSRIESQQLRPVIVHERDVVPVLSSLAHSSSVELAALPSPPQRFATDPRQSDGEAADDSAAALLYAIEQAETIAPGSATSDQSDGAAAAAALAAQR